jgi:hypothetical protein
VAEVLYALYNQTMFQSSQGHRHFMIVRTPNLWSWQHMEIYQKGNMQISQQYPKLWNVTIGKVFDQEGCEEARAKGLLVGSSFQPMMLDCGVAMSRSSFSCKLYPIAELFHSFEHPWRSFGAHHGTSFITVEGEILVPIHPIQACLTKQNHLEDVSRIQYWVRHRIQLSGWSTLYRHDSVLSFEETIRCPGPNYEPSKWGASRSLCPISWDYAPIFKSLIKVSDYSIMVDEDEFLADPIAALMNVKNISEDVLCKKMEYLKLAQRLLY